MTRFRIVIVIGLGMVAVGVAGLYYAFEDAYPREWFGSDRP